MPQDLLQKDAHARTPLAARPTLAGKAVRRPLTAGKKTARKTIVRVNGDRVAGAAEKKKRKYRKAGGVRSIVANINKARRDVASGALVNKSAVKKTIREALAERSSGAVERIGADAHYLIAEAAIANVVRTLRKVKDVMAGFGDTRAGPTPQHLITVLRTMPEPGFEVVGRTFNGREQIKPIPLLSLDRAGRLAWSAGFTRVPKVTRVYIMHLFKRSIEELTRNAALFAEHRRVRTVSEGDVIAAFQAMCRAGQGANLY